MTVRSVTANVRLGMQGWDRAAWVGSLYPSGIARAAMLGQYSSEFSTVEVDQTFYGIPPEPVVARWRDTVPASFVFALKVPQQITHERRFAPANGRIARFLDRVVLLEHKLGPLLLLVPASFLPTEEMRATLKEFLRALPAGFKWALEVRHTDWMSEDLLDVLRARGIALVLAESRWIRHEVTTDLASTPTADFCYVRWDARPSARARNEDSPDGSGRQWAWTEVLEQASGLVASVYGYFHSGFDGDGLRCAREAAGRVAAWQAGVTVPSGVGCVDRISD